MDGTKTSLTPTGHKIIRQFFVLFLDRGFVPRLSDLFLQALSRMVRLGKHCRLTEVGDVHLSEAFHHQRTTSTCYLTTRSALYIHHSLKVERSPSHKFHKSSSIITSMLPKGTFLIKKNLKNTLRDNLMTDTMPQTYLHSELLNNIIIIILIRDETYLIYSMVVLHPVLQ